MNYSDFNDKSILEISVNSKSRRDDGLRFSHEDHHGKKSDNTNTRSENTC